MRLKLTLAYDGTAYAGWQWQRGVPTVQETVEAALARLEGRPVRIVGAGRTDAGVHALGQVASCDFTRAMPPADLRRALNACLPPDVRVLSVEEADPGFHARYGARSKTYRYWIWNGAVLHPFLRHYAWHLAVDLSVDDMRAALEAVTGRRDFAAFQSSGSSVTDTIRTLGPVSLEVRDAPGWPLAGPEGLPATGRLLEFTFTADGFLRHMVRAIVGTVVEVGSGRRAPGSMARILAGRDRSGAGVAAPAHGLCLMRVRYDERAPDGRVLDEPYRQV